MSRIPQYTIRQVMMTPDLAAKLLGNCKKNRPVNANRVDRYKAHQSNGAWDARNPLGCMTCVAADGSLLDSQHRLRAIVASGASVPWILIENVHPKARATMDIGRAWSPGDYLGANGYGNANKTAAIAKMIFSVNRANYEADPSREELAKEASAYREDIEWCITEVGRASSPIAAAFAWAHATLPAHLEEIQELARQVRTGDDCSMCGRSIRRTSGMEVMANGTFAKQNTMTDRWNATMLTLRLIEVHIMKEDLTRMPYFKEKDQQSRLIKRLRGLDKRKAS
jgi:hypothetical protein